jgi:hypothetical protein
LQDGQAIPVVGQVASLTSGNNFINFCATTNLPITNGKQITTGSCNAAPMGILPSTANLPSSKFVFPKNFDTVAQNTSFSIQMAIQNLETGNFVNAQTNYYSAPQQVNSAGNVIGHSHFVVEPIESFTSTTPLDIRKFAFFQGVNGAAVNGVLTVNVTAGLPEGFYKLSSINSAANHQPVLAPIAQHGSMDDVVYFQVTADGKSATSSNAGSASASNNAGSASKAGTASTSSSAASASTSSKASSKQTSSGKNKARRERRGFAVKRH